MLLALMLLVTLILIGLALEAPKIGQQIKRDKEEELIHRGGEYKNAIKKYFRKFGQYPVSLDQLSSTNNMRFLRKRFKDPFTGKDDWRILHPGEVQINAVNGGTVAAGQVVQGQLGQPGQQFGQASGALNQPGSFATPAPSPSPSPQAGTDPNTSGAVPGAGTAGITPAGNLTGGLGSSPVIGGGPMVGVSSTSTLKSIKEINGKEHYNEWQFVYDPRLEPALAPPGAPGTTNPIGGNIPGQPPAQNPTTGPTGMTQPRITN
jgi:type II secretory pathway pseudopilin PulG